MVVLEAQAAGVPVIASNVGGVPDLIENGVTGLLTDPARPASMPEALQQLLDNPELARKLAERGRNQARGRYTPAKIAGDHLNVYRSLVQEGRGQ